MRKIPLITLVLAVSATTLCAQNEILPNPPPRKPATTSDLHRLRLGFEANTGQTEANVHFLTRGPGYSLFLRQNDAVIAIKHLDSADRINSAKPGISSSAVVQMGLLGANQNAVVHGAEELPGRANYFIGNDPSKWRTQVPIFSKVKYEGVYPGIDLVYYGNLGQLEYDFIVAPGTDPNVIRLRFSGAEKLVVDEQGDLSIGSQGLRFEKPAAYQDENGVKKAVQASYRISANNIVGFALSEYDHHKPLVIDPVLTYSTYLGGSGGDAGAGIAVDSSGNAYVTGTTASVDFPTVHALQGSIGSTSFDASNVFISKISPGGSALIYSTYLGGNFQDSGFGIAVDSSGNAYVTGEAGSTNFPVVNAIQAVDHASGGPGVRTGFVTKINSSGSALIYSTFLGGSFNDTAASIAVDNAGNAYVTGTAQSSDFPTLHALQKTLGSGANTNAFVTKINPSGSAFVYSTYLGGGGDGTDDFGFGIAADVSGNAYVTGSTRSTSFPTANALQPALKGGQNAFVTKINANGSAFIYSTYLGGSSSEGDNGNGIAADALGNAYITGHASSPDFPTAHALQPTLKGDSDAFVTKISPTGSALVYSTFLGGSGRDEASSIGVDEFGDAYVTGDTESVNFPTVNAFQAAFAGGSLDGFVTEIDPTGTRLIYSTYLGGGADDLSQSIAVDLKGSVYMTGLTDSSDFPTERALQPALGGKGATNAFVVKIASRHPLFLHALRDLDTARFHLASVNEADVMREVTKAIQEIDEAIAAIKTAAIDDDKDLHNYPPVDAGPDLTGPFHRSVQLLEKARMDISTEEDNGSASSQELRKRALGHLDNAIQQVNEAIQFIATHS